MVRHEDLEHAGSVPHYALESRLTDAESAIVAATGQTTALDAELRPAGGYGTDDMLMSASAVRLPGSSAPSWNAWKTTLELLDFGAAGGEYAHFITQFAHRYDEGSNFTFHVHFVPRSQIANGQTVTFRITYSMADRNELFPSTATKDTTYTSSGVTATDTHCMTTGVTVGSFQSASGCIVMRLERLAADTYAGTAGLVSADFHFNASKLGT